MSQVITAADNLHTNIAQKTPISLHTRVFLAIAGLLHLPYVIPQAQTMWESEHYSFFPLAFVAFFYLAWERLKETTPVYSYELNKKNAVYCFINLILFSLAAIANSHWLGWVSFLFLIWTATHIILSPENVRKIRGTFWILLLIIPLPLNLDTALVIHLQKVATEQASLLLDFAGIYHSVTGVTVTLPTKVFQVDDACSGIRSLFSAVTTMLIFAVYSQYKIIRMLLTLAQTALWVLIVNSFRVFFVVFAFQKWDAGLESGWRHDALGVVCYLTMILLAFSTDQFLRYFFPVNANSPWGRKLTQISNSLFGSLRNWLEKPVRRKTSLVLSSFLLLGFFLAGSAGVARDLFTAPRKIQPIFENGLEFSFTENDLPEEVNGWKRVGFRAVNRDRSDPFGMNSLIWTYERNGLQVQFSIDGAYRSFHELLYCYTGIGWNADRVTNLHLPLPSTFTGNTTSNAMELQLTRGENEKAYVAFCCYDSTGQLVEPPVATETAYRRLLNRLRSGNLLGRAEQQVVPPVIQFQAFSYSDFLALEHEHPAIKELFSALGDFAQTRISATP